MKQHPLDADLSTEVERLVLALRADLPAASDATRVRNRLVSAGVLATGFASSAAAAAVAKSNFPVNTAKAALDAAGRVANTSATAANVGADATAQLLSGATQTSLQMAAAPAGLFAKVIALPAAVKVGAGGGLIALALSTAPALERGWQEMRVTAQRQESALAQGQASTQRQQLATREASVAPASPAVSLRSSVVVAETVVGDVQATPMPQSVALVKQVEAKTANALLPKSARLGQASAVSIPLSKQSQIPVIQVAALRRGQSDDGRALDLKLGAEAVESPRAASVTASSLGEETPLISRALQALKAGDVDSARAALSEHERRFPSGILSPERERTRAKLID